ncbi:MAG: polysaccharide biosynthesis/export family protein [Pseudomonadota bacterium]
MLSQLRLLRRALRLVLLASLVTACTLPRGGPNRNEILDGGTTQGGDAFVVPVTDDVTRAVALTPALGFSQNFLSAGTQGSDVIRPGDVLGVTVWENVEAGILGTASAPTPIDEVQVDGKGFIFVPYAGRVRASGNTPEQLREIITEKLEAQTPDPQVVVRRMAGDGSTVSIVGGVGAQGVYPIERPTRTLTAMLARAGGVTIAPEIAQVTIIRGNNQSKVWLQDLYRDPKFDIALRGGDRILVEEDTRAFTAVGATGAQARVTFTSQNISAMEAIAQVGGLNTQIADPTGIFILRNEPEDISRIVLNRDDLSGTQRVVYILDLTKPNGLFHARDFLIRDDDTIYVTEAPFVRFNKALAAFLGPLNTAASVDTLVN